jgi:UDP-N-acetylglucosamine acyltransferase
MVGGFSGVNKDLPPFMLVRGPSVVRAPNLVGIRRAKISREGVAELREAFRLLYRTDLSVPGAVAEIRKLSKTPESAELISFIESSKRGICQANDKDEEFYG